jgi:hypothetical protein
MLFHYASTFLPLRYVNKFLPSDLKSPGLQLNSVPTLAFISKPKESTSTFNFASESFFPHIMASSHPTPFVRTQSMSLLSPLLLPSCSVSLVSSPTSQLLAIVVGSINLAQRDGVLPTQFFRFSISLIPCSCKLPEQYGELKTEKCST